MQEGETTEAPFVPRRLSDEEVKQALNWLAEARAFRERVLAERGGKLFDDSTEIIREAREQRSRELLGE